MQTLGSVVAAITYSAMGVAGGLLGACIFNLIACFTILAVRPSEGQNKSPEGETQKTDNTRRQVRSHSFRKASVWSEEMHFFAGW